MQETGFIGPLWERPEKTGRIPGEPQVSFLRAELIVVLFTERVASRGERGRGR